MFDRSSLRLSLLLICLAANAGAQQIPDSAEPFLSTYCIDCHHGDSAEAGLDLSSLSKNVADLSVARRWTEVLRRVTAHEMPPSDAEAPGNNEHQQFVQTLTSAIRSAQWDRYRTTGRVPTRRLSNLQLERSLQDLLGIDIPLTQEMSDEPRTDGFSTVAEGQAISHFQLEQHVKIVDLALEEAFRRALTEPDEWTRKLSAAQLVRRNPRRRTREPEMLGGKAVTWSSRLVFYGRLPSTTVKEDGWYRFTIKASALKPPTSHDLWCTARAGKCTSSAPLLKWMGALEATKQPQEFTVEGWMNTGDMLEVRPGDQTLKMAKFQGGQVGAGEGGPQNVPGIAIEWIRMQRVHRRYEDKDTRRFLFKDFEVNLGNKQSSSTVALKDPNKDIQFLIRSLARRAFRRKVSNEDLWPYIKMAKDALEGGASPLQALRVGYRAVLCSPRFLYFHEAPGGLDDHAIATRLSYMLTGSTPDWQLMVLANEGKLKNRDVLIEQTNRLLSGQRGNRFVQDFAAQWLDLSLIDFTEPDPRLYPGFDLIVQNAMLEETHHYLAEMLQKNQGVQRLIQSDHTYLNSRLARYYGIDGVGDPTMQRVSLRTGDRPGGLLTHGSIMKVTANGTTTSPVIRGVWISERLLGEHIPPPPASVPAIEPDVRGAKSIREMLEKHKSDAACAVCHRKIDPPGYALENFDPSGRWREYYGSARRKSKGRSPVQPAYKMPDGQEFKDLKSFQSLIAGNPHKLARNLVEQLITYGTGAGVEFADLPEVHRIVARTEPNDFGFRSIIHEVVCSPIFLTK